MGWPTNAGSLPYRQLRNVALMRLGVFVRSLPYRQLRKNILEK